MKNVEVVFHISLIKDTKGIYIIPSINVFWCKGYFQLEIGWLFWTLQIIKDNSIL